MKQLNWIKLLIILLIGLNQLSIAQTNLNFGLGIGPGLSLTSVPFSSNSKVESTHQLLSNLHISVFNQFLFKNKFGIESGFAVSTKNMIVKLSDSNNDHKIFIDSFSFPFLLLFRKPLRSIPFVSFNYLIGVTSELQHFVKNNSDVRKKLTNANIVHNLTTGFRISFKKGVLGRIETGISASYALSAYYLLSLEDAQTGRETTFKPKAHFLKFDLIYLFSNKIGL